MIDEYQFFYDMGIVLDESNENEDEYYYDDTAFGDSIESYDP